MLDGLGEIHVVLGGVVLEPYEKALLDGYGDSYCAVCKFFCHGFDGLKNEK